MLIRYTIIDFQVIFKSFVDLNLPSFIYWTVGHFDAYQILQIIIDFQVIFKSFVDLNLLALLSK